MSKAPHNPITTKQRLPAPLNADLFTTVRQVSQDKPIRELGETMNGELGPNFSNHYIVGVLDVPIPDTIFRQATWTHFQRVRITNQHARNFAITEGDVLVRTYVMLRVDYPDDESGDYKLGPAPTVGTADDRFPRYGYTHESVMDSDFGLGSVFVIVQRFFQKIERSRTFFDPEFDREVRETVTFIAKGTNAISSTIGVDVGVDDSHTQYDVRTVTRLLPNDSDATVEGNLVFPLQLSSLPTTINKRFPDLLVGVKLVSAYAFAAGGDDAPSYSEDFYFDPKIIHPFPGPHEGRILRFLTDDPDSILARYPIVQWVEEVDTIPLLAAWWSTINGNSTFALADQVSLPPTVHGRIAIELIETLAIVQQKGHLEATPGFSTFAAMHAGTVDYDVKKTRWGFEIGIYQVNGSGLYSGTRVPFDQEGGNTGAGQAVVDTTPAPEVSSGAPATDNLSISGRATAGSAVTAIRNNVEIGKAMSNSTGDYLIRLDPPAITDAVQVQIKARKAGVTSGALVITMRDLAPGRPLASISSDLATVSGSSQVGATITIGMTPQAQVERAEVVGTISLDGQSEAIFTSALTGDITVHVDSVNGDSASTTAARMRTALRQQGVIDDAYDITGTGAYIIATKRPPITYDDPTLNIAVGNGSAAGLTDAPTSTEITQGLGAVTLTVPAGGEFSHVFDPPLPNGTILTITASDLGGTSPALTLEANATPPLVDIADFETDSYVNIVGTVSIGGGPPADGAVTVKAYLGDLFLEDATNDPSGNFSIALPAPRFSGESITIIASLTSSPNVSSPGYVISAANLLLPAPAFSLSAGEYIGAAPTPASIAPAVIDKLVVRYELTSEEVEFDIFTANNEFAFDFEDFSTDIGNQNGERYEVFFRYDLNPSGSPMLVEGPITYINSPQVPLTGAVVGVNPPGRTNVGNAGTVWSSNWPGAYYSGTSSGSAPDGAVTGSGGSSNKAYVPGATGFATAITPVPFNYACAVALPAGMPAGCTIQIDFPGQDLAPIGPEVYAGPYYLGDSLLPTFPYQYRNAGQRLDNMGGIASSYWPMNATALVNGWYARNAMWTKAQILAAIPARLRITVTAPDGRSSETVWTRDENYPFNDPNWKDLA